MSHSDHDLEQAIRTNLAQFELLALIRLLTFHGYRQIWFKSSDQLVSETQLLTDIRFTVTEQDQESLVILSLNMGMLSPQGPLPSYFLKLRDSLLINDRAFTQYIDFFDHILISNLVKQLFPELSSYYGIPWPRWQRDSLFQTNLKAIRNVQMIFDAVFPEYLVSTGWEVKASWQSSGAELGAFKIGKTVGLGGAAKTKLGWLKVVLTGPNNSVCVTELYHRLKRVVLPLFNALSIPLEVFIQGRVTPLQLARDEKSPSPHSLLGFHPLEKPQINGQLCLFSANTHSKRAHDE
ncbi:hypothetical protein QL989_03710 [Pseudoalteromonas sp. APC 3224]|uniref:hypothetical protein n=1 Tax=Pseudoalteromonas sp. APC 3224 TaxID=3035203 RepID=UPI0025B4D534|nr:hypothetical protein [Pseudoalteromonas sp. APC 3224]MDN3484448.1 hypothetical protein [Pseudoalteromonas sp. APC 3224]